MTIAPNDPILSADVLNLVATKVAIGGDASTNTVLLPGSGATAASISVLLAALPTPLSYGLADMTGAESSAVTLAAYALQISDQTTAQGYGGSIVTPPGKVNAFLSSSTWPASAGAAYLFLGTQTSGGSLINVGNGTSNWDFVLSLFGPDPSQSGVGLYLARGASWGGNGTIAGNPPVLQINHYLNDLTGIGGFGNIALKLQAVQGAAGAQSSQSSAVALSSILESCGIVGSSGFPEPVNIQAYTFKIRPVGAHAPRAAIWVLNDATRDQSLLGSTATSGQTHERDVGAFREDDNFDFPARVGGMDVVFLSEDIASGALGKSGQIPFNGSSTLASFYAAFKVRPKALPAGFTTLGKYVNLQYGLTFPDMPFAAHGAIIDASVAYVPAAGETLSQTVLRTAPGQAALDLLADNAWTIALNGEVLPVPPAPGSPNATGTSYAAGNVLLILGGTYAPGFVAQVKVTAVSSGVITTFSVVYLGQYVTLPPAGAGVTGGLGTGATFTVTDFGIALVSGGGTYAVNDLLTVVGGQSYAQATVTADAVTSIGAVVIAHVSNPGAYTVSPGASPATTGGAGTGAKFYLGKSVTLWAANGGTIGGTMASYVVNDYVIFAQQAAGAQATGTATLSGGAIIGGAVTSGGGPYKYPPPIYITDSTGTGADVYSRISPSSGAVTNLYPYGASSTGTGYSAPSLTAAAPPYPQCGYILAQVTSVSAGAVTGLKIIQSALWTTQPIGVFAQASTSGTGTGVTLTLGAANSNIASYGSNNSLIVTGDAARDAMRLQSTTTQPVFDLQGVNTAVLSSVGTIAFRSPDAVGNVQTFSDIESVIGADTAGAVTGRINLNNWLAGVKTTEISIEGGVQIGLVSGGYKGAGNLLIQNSLWSGTGKQAMDPTGNLLKQIDRQTPTSGFSHTIAGNCLLILGSSTLASGTVTLPAGMTDGSEVVLKSEVVITAFTLAVNATPAGQTIDSAPTSLAAGQSLLYVFDGTNLVWRRITPS